MKPINASPRRTKTVERGTLLRLLRAALKEQELRFARQCALSWLAAFPGDLEVRLLQAQVLLAAGQDAQAVQFLEQLIIKDPLDPAPYRLLAQACQGLPDHRLQTALTNLYALGVEPASSDLLAWGMVLRAAYQAVEARRWEEAGPVAARALRLAPDSPLAAVLHLLVVQSSQGPAETVAAAGEYRQRWPDCLPVNLVYASAQIESGAESEGVWLLHHCAADDAAGQAPRRLWGEAHRYRSLWPEEMVIPFDLPIPAAVATHFGWNQLGPGSAQVEPVAAAVDLPEQEAAPMDDRLPVEDELALDPLADEPPQEVPETTGAAPIESGLPAAAASAQAGPRKSRSAASTVLKEVESEFERLAKQLKQPALAREDGRFPVYVIFTCRKALIDQYGAQTAAIIDQELNKLAAQVSCRPGWDALVFVPDDPDCVMGFGLEPVDGNDPWKLKLALGDLDKALYHRGEMIGAVLIVGGDRIIPFHRLPNPTEDIDREVPSDSPYGALDSNYFIPDWPVGRLPGEEGTDANLLLEQLRRVLKRHSYSNAKNAAEPGWLRRLMAILRSPTRVEKANNLGYTAAVWRRSSVVVFRPLGDPHAVLSSPPTTSGAIDPEAVTKAGLGYYNLHGVEDGSDWYGQRDPAEGGGGPDYPVALSPQNLKRNGHAPQVVFSEACYGGHIFGKTESQSVALKFLGIGTQAVVASTCISYGSVATPLIAADLLGSLFWKHLTAGFTVGEALRQARIDLAREMNRRQGFLDGEDQKALISFVLYGDPLGSFNTNQVQTKGTRRLKISPNVRTASEQPLPVIPASSSEMVKRVKSMAAEYLPGAHLKTNQPFEDTLDVTLCRQHPEGARTIPMVSKDPLSTSRMVVTVSKQVQVAHHLHRHYFRVTLDEGGKPIKLAISR